jgi:hypothetical protein
MSKTNNWFISLSSTIVGFLIGFFISEQLCKLQPKRDQIPQGFCPLTRANMIALLEEAQRSGTDIDLQGADLHGADLSGLDFSNANLRNANISAADLRNSSLVAADLRGADATEANFVDAKLAGACIYEMKLDNASLPGYVFRPSKNKPWIVGDWEHAKKTDDVADYHYARAVALALKYHLQTTGRYSEAVQAHQLEQRIVRALVNPLRRLRWHRKQELKVTIRELVRFGFRWIISWLADVSCGYGESITRTFLSIVVIQVMFTMGYWLTGSIVDSSGPVRSLSSAIIFSFATMTTTNLQELSPANSLVELVMSLQVLLGIAFTGLLGFVLGNRVRYSS